MRDDTPHESHSAGGSEDWTDLFLMLGAVAFTVPAVIICAVAAWHWL